MDDRSNHPSPPETAHVQRDTTASEQGPSSIAWGVTVISTVSLILTLLGYGVSLAVETTFGVPHQTVYSSVVDLLGLSVYALISVIEGLGKISVQPLLDQAWLPSLLAAGGMFLLLLSLVFFKRRRVRMGSGSRWRLLTRLTPQDSRADLFGKAALGSTLFGGLVFATPFLLVGAVMTIILLISIVPIFGMQAGVHYLQKYVVTPTACEPVKSRSALLHASSATKKANANANAEPVANATCITALKDETQVASGRVVVSTPTVIVLFEPDGGSVRRLPLGELTVIPTDTVQPTPATPDEKAQQTKRADG